MIDNMFVKNRNIVSVQLAQCVEHSAFVRLQSKFFVKRKYLLAMTLGGDNIGFPSQFNEFAIQNNSFDNQNN